MEPKTFIIMGMSGSGTTTQSQELIKYLDEKGSNRPSFHLQTGEEFRKLIHESGYTNSLAETIYERGDLEPEFLAIYLWADVFVKNLKGGEHLILDGTPRKVAETSILKGALNFYGMSDIFVIYLKVSREWAKERMMERGREDDVRQQSIEDRLDWFETEVLPIIEAFKSDPDYNLIEVNGEQTIEEVHQEIVQKLSL